MTPEEMAMHLRMEWWLNHGCPPHARYGDDGEMQCNAMVCRVDFRRESLEVLYNHVACRRLAIVCASSLEGRS